MLDVAVKATRTASPALSDVLGGLSGTKCTYWVALGSPTSDGIGGTGLRTDICGQLNVIPSLYCPQRQGHADGIRHLDET